MRAAGDFGEAELTSASWKPSTGRERVGAGIRLTRWVGNLECDRLTIVR